MFNVECLMFSWTAWGEKLGMMTLCRLSRTCGGKGRRRCFGGI